MVCSIYFLLKMRGNYAGCRTRLVDFCSNNLSRQQLTGLIKVFSNALNYWECYYEKWTVSSPAVQRHSHYLHLNANFWIQLQESMHMIFENSQDLTTLHRFIALGALTLPQTTPEWGLILDWCGYDVLKGDAGRIITSWFSRHWVG